VALRSNRYVTITITVHSFLNKNMKPLLLSIIAAQALALGSAADTTKPVVSDFSFSPKIVVAGSTFTASITVSDQAGVDRVLFKSYPSAGWWYPCSGNFILQNGTVFDGTWIYECLVASNTPNGKYGFNYACYDTSSNQAFKNFPTEFEVVGGVAPDYNAPVISKVTYPSESPAGSEFTAYLTITDESGVAGGYMVVRESVGNYVGCTAENIVLYSGTPTDGVFKASCFIPSSAPNGEYYLEIHVNDVQNNPADLYEYHAFNLYGGAAADHINPSISSIKFSSTHVHVGETLEITARIKDAQSGVNHVSFSAMETYTSTVICKGDMALVSGSKADGTWSFSCVIPSGVEYTVYQAQIYAYDNQNNLGYSTGSFYVDYQ
jgi:hypothetical protein